jgi:hypothetical protein
MLVFDLESTYKKGVIDMRKPEDAMFELRSIRREQDSVEVRVAWFIDHKTSDELISDPEYQGLEAQAFDLFYRERELCKEIERDEFLCHEAKLVSI